MNIKTKILTLAAAGGIVLAGVAGATGYASAQEPGTTPDQPKREKRIERRDNFLGRVAANLGVTLDQLKQAFKSAATQAVDDALANGDITQEQADKIKAKIESGEGLGLSRLLGGGQGRHGKPERVQKLRDGIINSVATALNMSPEDVKAQLKSGKSIADVAGGNLDAVKTQITNDAKAKLDAAVASGKLTQDKADAMLEKLTDSLDKILSKIPGKHNAPPAP
jgi:hypothetical protein